MIVLGGRIVHGSWNCNSTSYLHNIVQQAYFNSDILTFQIEWKLDNFCENVQDFSLETFNSSLVAFADNLAKSQMWTAALAGSPAIFFHRIFSEKFVALFLKFIVCIEMALDNGNSMQ